jgi:hypothetical protein
MAVGETLGMPSAVRNHKLREQGNQAMQFRFGPLLPLSCMLVSGDMAVLTDKRGIGTSRLTDQPVTALIASTVASVAPG